ncbi:MAG: hypothetical protein HXY42_12150 [Chloroflexi bacterium]|nr:hypothetical protein [Chloroflexota bacterium]
MSDKYKITLELSEPEFLALARIGYREFRSPRNQARFLLRDVLTSLGALPGAPTVYNPVPDPAAEVSGRD